MVSADFDVNGPWGGVDQIFSTLFPEIQATRPDLVRQHDLELVYILPQLRHVLKVRNPSLTDLAPREERVRNYAADRAFRVIHGLIDMLDSWKTAASPQARWVIACDGYDVAGSMSKRFFSELIRRRGVPLHLDFLFSVKPQKASEIQALFPSAARVEIIVEELTAVQPDNIAPETAAEKADELELRLGEDPVQIQANLPELIRLCGFANRPDKVLRYRFTALEAYNTMGLYEDALRYGDGLLKIVWQYAPDDHRMQWLIVLKLLMSNTGLQRVGPSLELAESEGLKMAAQIPDRLVRMYFLIAMFYALYSKPRDFANGQQYLDLALAVIDAGGLPEDEAHFHRVFNRNGLAMIRNFQGRHQEAIKLCQDGIAYLDQHLSVEKHRLHRSVLVYNTAQVYRSVGSHHEAIKYYSAVIEMDPNYSEYYNERGSIFLQLNLLEEALADYLKAIELSPPYYEVFTNLGQCYRKMGVMNEAAQAYSRALDLEPDHVLALLGRAKSFQELGKSEMAKADYGAALARDPGLWDALASRAVIHYEAGDLAASLADFNRAIELKQDETALFQNRATVLFDLGRYHEAVRDLENALKLDISEPEQTEIQTRLKDILQLVPDTNSSVSGNEVHEPVQRQTA